MEKSLKDYYTAQAKFTSMNQYVLEDSATSIERYRCVLAYGKNLMLTFAGYYEDSEIEKQTQKLEDIISKKESEATNE